MRIDRENAFKIRLIATATILMLALKVVLAYRLDLYSDEVYYWLASTRLALAFSDLPFMTAWLVGLGAKLEPGSTLAVRSVFLILGSLPPLLLYWIALPMTGRRQALEAAGLGLCLPLGGFLGLLAVPDVPLIVFGLLALGFFERALRLDQLRYWLATGVVAALGLSTHYRFFLYPAAALLFLVLSTQGRKQWNSWRLWLCILLAAVGLTPILWFNLNNQLSSASFYLMERHPWEFQASGLLHVFKQAGLVTPPLYVALLLTIWRLGQRASRGDNQATLLLCFGLINLGVYLLLAPWTDADSTSIHWPLSGYYPLLIAVPQTLREVMQWLQARWSPVCSRRIVATVPILGFIGTLTALIGVGSQAWQEPLQRIVGTGVLSNKMAGWKEFAQYTRSLMQENYPLQQPLIITDNYYTAAQVEFAGLHPKPLTLDRDKAVRDGRSVQLNLWQMDASALPAYSGSAALYINEDSTLLVGQKTELMADMCASATAVTPLEPLALFNGDKSFSYYRIEALAPASPEPAFPCPYPIRAWIDSPAAAAELTGEFEVSGWAFSEDVGVSRVEILIDNEVVAAAEYGRSRPDVESAQGVQTDPNSPKLGFHKLLDSRNFSNGRHQLAVRIINALGSTLSYGERTIFIAN